MLLCVDMGNSHISLGVFKGEELILSSYLKTDINRSADQYAVDILSILRLNRIDTEQFSGSVLGSVVPALTRSITLAIEKVSKTRCLVIGPGVKTGLNIKIDDPATLGADLVCGGVAAAKLYPLPCIICDLGTATKMFAINKNGEFLGGMIASGVGISLNALSNQAAQLPQVCLDAPKNAISKNTIECMQSGTVLGTASMIDGMIDRFEKELGDTPTVVATGGFSATIIPHCTHKIDIDGALLFKGLKFIYEKNQ